MSQITSIKQCNRFMAVYHPIYGKGEITQIDKISKKEYEVAAKFSSYNHYFYSRPSEGYNHISHLYTTPVYICEKASTGEVNCCGDIMHPEDIYLPINPEP